MCRPNNYDLENRYGYEISNIYLFALYIQTTEDITTKFGRLLLPDNPPPYKLHVPGGGGKLTNQNTTHVARHVSLVSRLRVAPAIRNRRNNAEFNGDDTDRPLSPKTTLTEIYNIILAGYIKQKTQISQK